MTDKMPRMYPTEAGTFQVVGYGGKVRNFYELKDAQRELDFRLLVWELGLTPEDNPDEWREAKRITKGR
jgi:hypothetical protein